MDFITFTKSIKRNMPVGTILKNPGGGTSEVVGYTDEKIAYLRGKSRMYVRYEDLYQAYQKFKGQYVTTSNLRTFRPHVFDSSARPAGHSCNCTFLFLLLGQLGLASDIQGAGRQGNPFGVRIHGKPRQIPGTPEELTPPEETGEINDFPTSLPPGAKRIVLVSCVKTKKNETSPASELYISDLFMKTSEYARKIGDSWYILSAKYGLVPPDKIIEPYEKTLNTMGTADQKTWAEEVLIELKDIVSPGDEIIFLAGLRYREHLIPILKEWGCSVEIPMKGLTFGEQLSWLNEQIGE